MFTDNNPVAHLQNAKLGAVEQRWVAQMAAFDFEVKYRAGRENMNADALFRFPKVPVQKSGTTNPASGVAATTTSDQEGTSVLGEDWKSLQEVDPNI